MSLYLKLTLLNLLVFGAICTYTDVRQGKIYNRFIKWGFICGFLILIFSLSSSFDIGYLKNVLINGSIGFLLGFFLWLNKQWSAGDAKLFSFFSFFLPLRYYSDSYIPFFPSINILLNTFFIIITCLLVSFLFFITGKIISGKIYFKSSSINSENLLKFLKIIFGYVFIVYLLSQLSGIKILAPVLSNTVAVFFLVYFLYGPLSENKKIANFLSLLSLALVIFLLVSDPDLLGSIIRKAVIFVIFIGAVRTCFDFYIKHRETVKVRVKDLKKGQILLEKEIYKIKNMLKEKKEEIGFDEINNYGLNLSQIKIIKGLYSGEKMLAAYRSFHLAPLLFAGVLIAVLTRSSLIALIMQNLPGF